MRTGSFAIDTPIFTGDIVELPDPRRGEGGVERRYVREATPSSGKATPQHATHQG